MLRAVGQLGSRGLLVVDRRWSACIVIGIECIAWYAARRVQLLVAGIIIGTRNEKADDSWREGGSE